MNRVLSVAFRVAVVATLLCSGVNRMQAQAPAAAPPKQEQPKQDAAKPEAPKQESEEDQNPFAPKPAPPLPPGMTGSDANDPRAKLTPGLYDAGEAADGLEAHPAVQEA